MFFLNDCQQPIVIIIVFIQLLTIRKGWEHNRLMLNFGLFLFFAQIYLVIFGI